MTYLITRARAAIMDCFKGPPATVAEAIEYAGAASASHIHEITRWLCANGFIECTGVRHRAKGSGLPPYLYQITAKGNAALNLTYEALESKTSVVLTASDIELMQRSMAA